MSLKLVFTIFFWVFLAMFLIDVVQPSYTNAENMLLLCFLARYVVVTERDKEGAGEVTE